MAVEDPAFAVRLEEPSLQHEAAVADLVRELRASGETFAPAGADLLATPYDEWVRAKQGEARGEGLPEGWVPATTLFIVHRLFADGLGVACVSDEPARLVDASSGSVAGWVQIRHSIDHPMLRLYGGHIGYAVRPSQRRRGYAHQALVLACRYARDELGLSRVMLGCLVANEASRRTIASCGGVLDRQFTMPDSDDVDETPMRGQPVCTWWIDATSL